MPTLTMSRRGPPARARCVSRAVVVSGSRGREPGPHLILSAGPDDVRPIAESVFWTSLAAGWRCVHHLDEADGQAGRIQAGAPSPLCSLLLLLLLKLRACPCTCPSIGMPRWPLYRPGKSLAGVISGVRVPQQMRILSVPGGPSNMDLSFDPKQVRLLLLAWFKLLASEILRCASALCVAHAFVVGASGLPQGYLAPLYPC